MARDYYKVLIISQSGKGKTYSFRNMNRETTGFINVENKPLPFKGNFKFHGKPTAPAGVFAALKAYSENSEIDCIVIDSLSAVLDLFLAEAKRTKRGFDIYNHYNELISKFLTEVKLVEKEVFLTAHYEWIQDEGGAKERRAKTQGKAWEG
ncbi:MAG: AAA family ATPase, partial [Bacteroidales bacterium]|nr:AAA family ATPase [Bacteroidales bacterium]